ncbi:branched-chain amino acid aminotransferase [Lawsonella clevelandensis]|uniref:branched-chain-amino-acid transaminase n=1 Tax=Lawsonella clevelandensis TaxID=1528099 RepID=A0A0M4MYF3_9ACTN|nr:branched-chain amino acid aminotransferase [Lawsonella clevelandensis]ALE19418.1 branched-chain amino acid aminotransferase [Lawsonella clevelandensis]MDU7194000.1 branched-chain amino acid aminotransferase [Lawsonella clevelandensis]VHO01599.1 Branched-chain-amino-acid aminotransferase [Lawsonella clevelandensis]
MAQHSTFDIQRSEHPRTAEERAAILDNPGFGRYFTDHMVVIDYEEGKGWHNHRVVPYGPFSVDPAYMVLHYGQAIFEGLKAYRHADGEIVTFRPAANAARFQASAERMAMPKLSEEDFIDSIKELVTIDQDWVPQPGGEECLYLRPFMFATETGLGVHPAKKFTYVLIGSPAGAYFAHGVQPVTVWVSHEYVRACPGGTGSAKFAGNYAASLAAQDAADKQGCDQVLWLDAIKRENIEEMGGMNVMFVAQDGDDVTVITPALSGSLLPGITRDSLKTVAQDLGYKLEERVITLTELADRVAKGEITEAFACGTAAVINPIGTFKSRDGEFTVNEGKSGDITLKMRATLTGIQRGERADDHNWLYKLV